MLLLNTQLLKEHEYVYSSLLTRLRANRLSIVTIIVTGQGNFVFEDNNELFHLIHLEKFIIGGGRDQLAPTDSRSYSS